MPRIKTLKQTHKGATVEASLHVNSAGEFSITRPGVAADWPDSGLKIHGKRADEVESEWRKSVRDYIERTKVSRRVIVVKFDSTIRENGKRDFFTKDDAMILLECIVAEEITTSQGEESNKIYKEPEEFQGLHAPSQPFPPSFQLSFSDLNFRSEHVVVVDWSQEMQDMLVRACNGIQAIVDMLDGATASVEALQRTLTNQTLQLGAPKS